MCFLLNWLIIIFLELEAKEWTFNLIVRENSRGVASAFPAFGEWSGGGRRCWGIGLRYPHSLDEHILFRTGFYVAVVSLR